MSPTVFKDGLLDINDQRPFRPAKKAWNRWRIGKLRLMMATKFLQREPWKIHHFDGIYQERWDFHGLC